MIFPPSSTPDYLRDRNASLKLLRTIKSYWSKRGKSVDVWLEDEEFQGQKIWTVRSNLKFKVTP